jgi:3-hydroxybutyryl-CoA dehydrogenase
MSTAATRRADVLDDVDIAVVGAGLMGAGIAQVFARLGARVALHDPVEGALARARARMKSELEAVGADPAAAAWIRLCPELDDAVVGADWVFEAVPEDLALKQDVFARLDALTGAGTVLATNTSVMRVTEIAARAARHPERILGTHWWNPPALVPLVEVVQGERTAPAAITKTITLLEQAGKTPVHVRRDVPGFIGNRLQHALWRQAFALVDAGVCDAEAVDTVIKSSFGPRLTVLGPMENADLVGLDLTKQIHDYVLPTLDPPSGTSPGLDEHVAAGRLGAKTGAGFRRWTEEEAAASRRRLLEHLAGAQPAAVTGGE